MLCFTSGKKRKVYLNIKLHQNGKQRFHKRLLQVYYLYSVGHYEGMLQRPNEDYKRMGGEIGCVLTISTDSNIIIRQSIDRQSFFLIATGGGGQVNKLIRNSDIDLGRIF